MKMRTAMKSVDGICDVKSENCTASKSPQALEVIYVGPHEKTVAVCPACLSKQLKDGTWAMWYMAA